MLTDHSKLVCPLLWQYGVFKKKITQLPNQTKTLASEATLANYDLDQYNTVSEVPVCWTRSKAFLNLKVKNHITHGRPTHNQHLHFTRLMAECLALFCEHQQADL